MAQKTLSDQAIVPQDMPLVVLQHPAVLLPGTTMRIVAHERPDITAMLAATLSKTTQKRLIACLPANGSSVGTIASIVGLQGRRAGDLVIVVRGVSRCKVGQLTKRDAYAAAQVQAIESTFDSKTYTDLKNELISLKLWAGESYPSTLLATAVAQRDRLPVPQVLSAVCGTQSWTSGQLADVLVELSSTAWEDRIAMLEAVDGEQRLALVIDILAGQSGVTMPTSSLLEAKLASDPRLEGLITALDREEGTGRNRRSKI